MNCAANPFKMGMFLQLEVSYKMGAFSDTHHTHPGIFIVETPPWAETASLNSPSRQFDKSKLVGVSETQQFVKDRLVGLSLVAPQLLPPNMPTPHEGLILKDRMLGVFSRKLNTGHFPLHQYFDKH